MVWVRTIVPKLSGWRKTQLSNCVEDNILKAHMEIVYLPKATTETAKHLFFLITQNMVMESF